MCVFEVFFHPPLSTGCSNWSGCKSRAGHLGVTVFAYILGELALKTLQAGDRREHDFSWITLCGIGMFSIFIAIEGI